MKEYRKLTEVEIASLKTNMCTAEDWSDIEVSPDFSPAYIKYVRFSGKVKLGSFNREFVLAGGIHKHSGIYYATLHNVTVGDDCCIENVKNYIANYSIGDRTFIENVDIILTDGVSTFGNGTTVSVLNETGGCEVMIFDRLSAHTAYIMTQYKERPHLVENLRKMILSYVDDIKSDIGIIGHDVVIADAGYIKNVRIGDFCKIEGVSKLKNGSLNSNPSDPIHIGVGVVADDFIISSGSLVEDGVMISRCFVGQACRLGHNYSASDSLFFSNCQGENGEACAIFAGPYTVTHHKSTLLIAGMFSFMNAGSGSNQSNHMYKLGPIHHGKLERGAKTASDSYILWPAKVGAFSLVMGRHVNHQDTSDLPFSYLIEQLNTSYIMPGANLKSVGTIRDAKKWPQRDKRRDPDKLDYINFNLLSPYTIQKMINGCKILNDLKKVSGANSDTYSYQSGKIKQSSLENGLKYYSMAIDKFLGNSLITKIMSVEFEDIEHLREALKPDVCYGSGNWVDISGLIVPEQALDELMKAIEQGSLNTISSLNRCFADLHDNYYDYEWKWAYEMIERYYEINLSTVDVQTLCSLISKWRNSVISLDELICKDAQKELKLSGLDTYDDDPFVASVLEHIRNKSALAERTLAKLRI